MKRLLDFAMVAASRYARGRDRPRRRREPPRPAGPRAATRVRRDGMGRGVEGSRAGRCRSAEGCLSAPGSSRGGAGCGRDWRPNEACGRTAHRTPGVVRVVITRLLFCEDRPAGSWRSPIFGREYVSGRAGRWEDWECGLRDGIGIVEDLIARALGEPQLATLDRRHFAVVRPRHCDALRLLPIREARPRSARGA